MTFSNLLRWGGPRRNSSAETDESATAPQNSSRDSRRPRRDRRTSPRHAAGGQGWLYWVEADGEPRRHRAEFVDVSEDGGGIGAIIPDEIPGDCVCWAVTGDVEPFPALVQHCSPVDNGFRVGARLNPERRPVGGWGHSRLRWVDADESLVEVPASIRNAEEGSIEVNAASAAAPGTLLLLEGREYSCLCVVRSQQAYGDRALLEVEPLTTAVCLHGEAAA